MRSLPLQLTSLALLLTIGVGAWLYWRDPLADLPPGELRPTVPANAPGSTIDKPVVPVRSHAGYTGSSACRECHAGVCDEYATHPMWHSARPVGEATTIEEYGRETGFTFADEFYFAEQTGGVVKHHIIRRDAAGADLYDQQAEVQYEIGAGDRGRAYLLQQGELLFQSALTWYSGKQGWDLSPGYVGLNRRFERRILDGCVTCHVGRAASDPDGPDRFATPAFIEGGISCERCHGPAAEHIAWHRQSDPPAGRDPIVNPEKLDFAASEAVCHQCHLTGVDRVLRSGRTEYDFRPGDRLTDIWMPFVVSAAELDSDSAPAVSHVEQIEASRCWTASAGQFGCTSCHDPHRKPAESDRVEYFRQRCLTCHHPGTTACSLPGPQRLARQADDSCIACHMPRRSSGDVPHTAQTDHRIRRSPLSESGAPAHDADHQVTLTQEAIQHTPDWEQQRARGIMLQRRAEQTEDFVLAQQALGLLQPLASQLLDDVPLQVASATVMDLTGAAAEARLRWEQILQIDPENEAALRALGIACHDAGQFELALTYFDRLLAINSYISDFHGRRSHILGRLGRWSDAVAAAHRAVELNPANAVLYRWLEEACRQTGQTELSREYSLKADQLERTPAPGQR